MKILLLGFAKYRYMPYANFYLDCIEKQKNEVHMVIWNRDLMAEKLPDNVIIHELRLKQEDQISPLKKIASFIKYRKFAKEVINKIRPDFVVVLHTFPGILLQNKLVSAYKGKFIFDYRDSTYESNGLFKNMVARIVESSGATFVSSDGFRRFLPDSAKEKIFTSHNISVSDINSEVRAKDKHFPIRVGCWGLLREEHLNKCIIKHLANDNRFELHYYGREQQIAIELKEYAKTLNAINVFFHGEYLPKERRGFAENTDILHNISSTGNMLLAMSNRVYDGMLYHIPWTRESIITCNNIYDISSIEKIGYIPTASFMYRKSDIERLPRIRETAFHGDGYLKIGFTSLGYAFFLNEDTCVYRFQVPGSATTLWNNDDMYIKSANKFIDMYEDFNKLFGSKYDIFKNRAIEWRIGIIIRTGKYKELRQSRYREYYRSKGIKRYCKYVLMAYCPKFYGCLRRHK